MKLLVVMAECPFPLRAGSEIVAFNNIKELAKRHDIHMVFRSQECGSRELDLKKYAKEITCVAYKRISFAKKLFLYAFSMALRVPTSVAMSRSSDMERCVGALVECGGFDAILLYQINAIQYCPSSSYNKVIVNIEDPQSIRLNRMRKLPIWSLWGRAKLFHHETIYREYEKRFLPKVRKVLLLSASDAEDMRKIGGHENVEFVPYGVGEVSPQGILDYEDRTAGMIVVTGNMFHPPNVDGVLFFLEKIYSSILSMYPAATLCIVGAEPDIRIRQVAAMFGDRVIITGKVDDISKYLRRAVVSVCPVRLKIGVQTKILEALSWGTPVVSTSAGNSGIGGRSGYDLWIEDDPLEFAKRVVALLCGEDWSELSPNGIELSKQYSWERSAAELERQIDCVGRAC